MQVGALLLQFLDVAPHRVHVEDRVSSDVGLMPEVLSENGGQFLLQLLYSRVQAFGPYLGVEEVCSQGCGGEARDRAGSLWSSVRTLLKVFMTASGPVGRLAGAGAWCLVLSTEGTVRGFGLQERRVGASLRSRSKWSVSPPRIWTKVCRTERAGKDVGFEDGGDGVGGEDPAACDGYVGGAGAAGAQAFLWSPLCSRASWYGQCI